MLRRVSFSLILLLVSNLSWSLANEEPKKVESVESILVQSILEEGTPLQEVREFTRRRVPTVTTPATAEAWQREAERIRQEMFDRVVFRGEAAKWRKADTKVQWFETIDGGPGYKIRKLRYEALPGFWIPALLYLPDKIEGKVPVVMNVNGHDGIGKAAEYKQIRCINQAKRGMIALNPEWIGMGQLKWEDYGHNRMNWLDLCGASGLAPFYLTMERGLDLLLSLEHADPERVAVAGLSGGGWQTIFISSLDPRVALANPVAGYSSFATRVDVPADLGDSEQTPVDMAIVADYCHLTALRAPRPTLLTYNAKDNCCFLPDGALPPLIQAAGPIFELLGKRANLRTHVNYIPGDHNFALDNRLELYRMFAEHFYPGDADFPLEEIPCQDELKTQEELNVDLPEGNATFSSLAKALAANLPRDPRLPNSAADVEAWQAAGRKRLASLVKAKYDDVEAVQTGEQAFDGGKATFWKLHVGSTWTVPAVEFIKDESKSTVMLLADEGRKSIAKEVERLLDSGHRVVAFDPFYFGESEIAERDSLYALLMSCVGERMLGIDASQIAAIARWSSSTYGSPVEIRALGPRTSLHALVAASLGPNTIHALNLTDSFASLKQILEQELPVSKAPELFCFGLLEYFDVKQLAALVAPRKVTFDAPSDHMRKELAGLKEFYGVCGLEFDPLP